MAQIDEFSVNFIVADPSEIIGTRSLSRLEYLAPIDIRRSRNPDDFAGDSSLALASELSVDLFGDAIYASTDALWEDVTTELPLEAPAPIDDVDGFDTVDGI